MLRLKGFQVDSTLTHAEALSNFWGRNYDLVLIDVEGDQGVESAEKLCAEIKTAVPQQLVAFVCNWRVANLTDCPDEIVRTEFDPAAFADGGRDDRRLRCGCPDGATCGRTSHLLPLRTGAALTG